VLTRRKTQREEQKLQPEKSQAAAKLKWHADLGGEKNYTSGKISCGKYRSEQKNYSCSHGLRRTKSRLGEKISRQQN
jgi:hypothetical protein